MEGQLAERIAATLRETEPSVLIILKRLVQTIGEERALVLFEETQQIEANGGMLINNGTRRRSPGGVFFKLAKETATLDERGTIFGPARRKNHKSVAITPLTSTEMMELSIEALKQPGEVNTMKITLVGRPGHVLERDQVVITALQGGKAPTLPKGLPVPPVEPVTFVVYIALKQWLKVKEAIANPEDKLIVEGYPVFNRRIGPNGTLTVYAQSCTTVHLKRQQQQSQDSQ